MTNGEATPTYTKRTEGGSCADGPATGLASRRDGRDGRTVLLVAEMVGTASQGDRGKVGNELLDHLDTLPQPAVDVDALKQVQRAFAAATEEGITEKGRLENVCLVLAEMRCDLEAQQPPAPGVVEALENIYKKAEMWASPWGTLPSAWGSVRDWADEALAALRPAQGASLQRSSCPGCGHPECDAEPKGAE